MASDNTRTRILEAAGAVFAERGFEKATVRDIANRAEVNPASINYHFVDKERLYAETLKHVHSCVSGQNPLREWPEGTSPELRLRDFIHTTLHRMLGVEAYSWQQRLMTREMTQPTGACRELVEEFIRPHMEVLLDILGEMLPDGLPSYKRWQIACSVIGQCLFYRFHSEVLFMLISEDEREKHYTPDQIADHITDVMLAALDRRALLGESFDPDLNDDWKPELMDPVLDDLTAPKPPDLADLKPDDMLDEIPEMFDLEESTDIPSDPPKRGKRK